MYVNEKYSLAKVTFEDTFLVKAHFLKHPGQVLLSIYFFCVFGLGYTVFVCERASLHVQMETIELEVFILYSVFPNVDHVFEII